MLSSLNVLSSLPLTFTTNFKTSFTASDPTAYTDNEMNLEGFQKPNNQTAVESSDQQQYFENESPDDTESANDFKNLGEEVEPGQDFTEGTDEPTDEPGQEPTQGNPNQQQNFDANLQGQFSSGPDTQSGRDHDSIYNILEDEDLESDNDGYDDDLDDTPEDMEERKRREIMRENNLKDNLDQDESEQSDEEEEESQGPQFEKIDDELEDTYEYDEKTGKKYLITSDQSKVKKARKEEMKNRLDTLLSGGTNTINKDKKHSDRLGLRDRITGKSLEKKGVVQIGKLDKLRRFNQKGEITSKQYKLYDKDGKGELVGSKDSGQSTTLRNGGKAYDNKKYVGGLHVNQDIFNPNNWLQYLRDLIVNKCKKQNLQLACHCGVSEQVKTRIARQSTNSSSSSSTSTSSLFPPLPTSEQLIYARCVSTPRPPSNSKADVVSGTGGMHYLSKGSTTPWVECRDGKIERTSAIEDLQLSKKGKVECYMWGKTKGKKDFQGKGKKKVSLPYRVSRPKGDSNNNNRNFVFDYCANKCENKAEMKKEQERSFKLLMERNFTKQIERLTRSSHDNDSKESEASLNELHSPTWIHFYSDEARQIALCPYNMLQVKCGCRRQEIIDFSNSNDNSNLNLRQRHSVITRNLQVRCMQPEKLPIGMPQILIDRWRRLKRTHQGGSPGTKWLDCLPVAPKNHKAHKQGQASYIKDKDKSMNRPVSCLFAFGQKTVIEGQKQSTRDIMKKRYMGDESDDHTQTNQSQTTTSSSSTKPHNNSYTTLVREIVMPPKKAKSGSSRLSKSDSSKTSNPAAKN